MVNPSFETLPSGGLPNGCGTACFYSNDLIPGWTSIGGSASGQFHPGTQAGIFDSLPNGPNDISAYTNGGTISQTVGTVQAAGLIYHLSVALGNRNDLGFGSMAELVVGNNVVVATGTIPSPGHWSTFTASFTSSAANVGQSISIVLLTNATGSGQGNFDNVRLNIVPEPGTLGMLGTGLRFSSGVFLFFPGLPEGAEKPVDGSGKPAIAGQYETMKRTLPFREMWRGNGSPFWDS